MEKAQDIDEMAYVHIKYLARLQEQALLSDTLKPILRAVISILDLAVLFHDTLRRSSQAREAKVARPLGAEKRSAKPKRRKSVIPAVVENFDEEDEASDRDELGQDAESTPAMQPTSSLESNFRTIDNELARLIPFLTAGLRNIGRVGAEPVWEMLAERLEWQKKDSAYPGLR